MKKTMMFLAAAAIGLASCSSGFKKGEGGLLYNIHEDSDGPTIKEGDFVSMNMVVKTDADSVLANSYDAGRPVVVVPMPKPQFKGDIVAAMSLLSQGDSATIKVNADSMFKVTPKPPGFKGKYVIYEIKVDKVIQKGKLSDEAFRTRVGDYFKGVSAKMKSAEPGKMTKYMADNNIKAQKTASGLYYQINKPGSGPNIAKGDTAVVNYTVKLLNGKVFDTSLKDVAQKAKIFNPMRPYQPMRVPVGVGAVIPGWDEGLLLLNKGAKATMIVPSSLAYGEQGYDPVPPFSPLVFDIEMVNIVHTNPNAPKPAATPQAPAEQPQVKK